MEKQKGSRPTWAQVREYESAVAELKEKLRLQLLADNDLSEQVSRLKTENERLEGELQSQIDGTSVLVSECDAWRKKYQELEAMYNGQLEGTSRLVGDCDAWRKKYRELEAECERMMSEAERMVPSQTLADLIAKNSELEESVGNLRSQLEEASYELDRSRKLVKRLEDELRSMKSRGFLARLFGR